MLIHEEVHFSNGDIVTATRSDQNVMIEIDGDLCDVGFNPVGYVRDYTETDIPCGTRIPDETEEYAKAGKILMGVE
jgi:hypothetical protein